MDVEWLSRCHGCGLGSTYKYFQLSSVHVKNEDEDHTMDLRRMFFSRRKKQQEESGGRCEAVH